MASKNILVIESDEAYADSIRDMFSAYDTEITVIADGKQGLEAAKSGQYDLILLCVELPKMSGYSICTKIKKDKKANKTPLIIMSSEATEETFEQHRKLKNRAEDYIIKPFSAEQIMEKVSALVQLEQLEVPAEQEIINLDDDDELVIEDLPDIEDEPLELDGAEEGATQVMSSPLLDSDDSDLENIDDVFDGLEMPGDDVVLGEEPGEFIQPQDDAKLEDLEDLSKHEEELDLEKLPQAPPADNDLPDIEIEDSEADEDVDALVANLEEAPDLGQPQADDLTEPPGIEISEGLEDDAGEADIDIEEALQPVEEPGETSEVPSPQETAGEPGAAVRDEEPQPESRPAADPVLLTKLENAESECLHLREKVGKLEQKLEETHRDYEKRIAELSSSRPDTAKGKDVLALKNTINAKDREILDLKEELNRKDQEILDVQEKIAERDEEIQRLQESIAKRDREIKEVSNRFDDMLRQKNDLQERHEAKMAEWEERYTNETAKLEHDAQVAREEMENLKQDFEQKLDEERQRLQQLEQTLEDTKQRHNDEVYGLRTRYKNEIDKLQQEMDELKNQVEQTSQELEQERQEHEQTRSQAEAVPQLESDLEAARTDIERLEQKTSELEEKLERGEQRVVKAYQKIKDDEKVKEKARKAVEIALTLLADQVSDDDSGDSDQPPDERDDAHT
ncbi:MAG: hypothetical protein DRI34_08860 [Deltaproteobacteria bacterium]|nr:MAG: hypothetical protein DRI34_08860 [Deltaproteobacteria bacterium]